jgi:hypothetical protein
MLKRVSVIFMSRETTKGGNSSVRYCRLWILVPLMSARVPFGRNLSEFLG